MWGERLDIPRVFGVRGTYSRLKLGAILGSTALYLTLAVVRGPDAGSILMLVTVPVVITAWSFGARAAIFASAVGFLGNGVIATALAGEDLRTWLSMGGLMGTSVLLVVGVTVGRLRDLSVRIEQAQDARQLLAGIATNMAEGVYLIRTSDGVIVYANERFEEMFGYDAGELIGKHVSVVNAPGEKSPEDTAREIIETLSEAGVWRGRYPERQEGRHGVLVPRLRVHLRAPRARNGMGLGAPGDHPAETGRSDDQRAQRRA